MSYKIDLNLDWKKIGVPSEAPIIAQGGSVLLFENIVSTCITSKYPNGLAGPKLRSYNRILNKLDSQRHEAQQSLQLETAEYELLKEIFNDETISILPGDTRLFFLYEERIQNAEISN